MAIYELRSRKLSENVSRLRACGQSPAGKISIVARDGELLFKFCTDYVGLLNGVYYLIIVDNSTE